MKRSIVLVALLAAVSGCGVWRNFTKDFEQGTSMLQSTITLYACDGHVIRTWTTKANVETSGGEAIWVGDDGHREHISGTFIVTQQ